MQHPPPSPRTSVGFRRHRWWLRALYALGLLIATSIFAAAAYWIDDQAASDYERIFNDQQMTAVQLSRRAIENRLGALSAAITHLARRTMPKIESGSERKATFPNMFEPLRASFPELLVLGYYETPDAPGMLAISGFQSAEQAEREAERWIQESWGILQDSPDAMYAPDLHITPRNRFLAIIAPVRTATVMHGAVIAVVNLNHLVNSYVSPLRLQGYGEVFLLDRHGRFLFNNARPVLGRSILEPTFDDSPVPSAWRLKVLESHEGHITGKGDGSGGPCCRLVAWATASIGTQHLTIGLSADATKVSEGFTSLRMQRTAFAVVLTLFFIGAGILLYRAVVARRLSYQDALLRTEQDTSPDGILVVDHNLYATFWNVSYLEQWHLEPQDLLPENREQAFSKIDALMPDPGAMYQHFLWLCEHPEVEEDDYELELRDGRVIERRSRGFFSDKGKHLGRIFWFRDITERKRQEQRIQEALEEFEAIFDNSMVGVLYVRENRIIVRVNALFAEMFGYTPEEMQGQSTRIIHTSDETYADFAATFIDRLKRSETVHAQYELRRKDDTPFWAEFTGKALDPSDLARGVIWVATDVTEQKKLEQLREDVEQIMRHDLKNPLHNVIYVPQLLRDDGNLTPQQLKLMDELEKSGYRMLDMVNRSMDLYKMERGTYKLSREAVDINDLLTRIITDLKPVTEARQVRIRRNRVGNVAPDTPFTAYGENLLLYSMLANLIRNAVEASPMDGVVTITLDDSAGAISIHNAGAVPKEIRSRFFEKFATAGKPGGTGLGTYSAALIARSHGGCIALETSRETGTSVTVKLPLWVDAPSPTCD